MFGLDGQGSRMKTMTEAHEILASSISFWVLEGQPVTICYRMSAGPSTHAFSTLGKDRPGCVEDSR
jgi:hypothetical protein